MTGLSPVIACIRIPPNEQNRSQVTASTSEKHFAILLKVFSWCSLCVLAGEGFVPVLSQKTKREDASPVVDVLENAIILYFWTWSKADS